MSIFLVRPPWLVIVAGTLILFLTFGVRFINSLRTRRWPTGEISGLDQKPPADSVASA